MRNVFQQDTNGNNFQSDVAQKGSVWSTITPCAPWQRAVYERQLTLLLQDRKKAVKPHFDRGRVDNSCGRNRREPQ